ncbi:armadillo-type protein [Mycena latifolia]|nr:armadillo-type protein [Mycena latifolia]
MVLSSGMDTDEYEAGLATEVLIAIATWPDGAEAIVALLVLHHVEWLASPDSWRRVLACMLLEALARHKSTAQVLLDLKPCERLITFLSDERTGTAALPALTRIANWPTGAAAVVAAQVLDHVHKWFASRHPYIRLSAYQLFETLARHKSTAGAVMDLGLCAQLITILELYADDYLVLAALDALGSIAIWPNGPEAIVAAKVLHHLPKGIASRWARARQSSCDLLATLARDKSTAQAVARAVPREQIFALLRDPHPDVRESADKALQAFDDYIASAQAPNDNAREPNVL